MNEPKRLHLPKPLQIPWMLGFCVFLAIALFFLWEEHRAHIVGALPYVLLLLCPLLHLFRHRGHGATAAVEPGTRVTATRELGAVWDDYAAGTPRFLPGWRQHRPVSVATIKRP